MVHVGLLVPALLLVACATSGAAPYIAPVSDAGGPRASYAAVQEIIQRSCAYVRCHDGPILGGDLRSPVTATTAAPWWA